MGNNTSQLQIPLEELKRLENQTYFNKYEINFLYKIFTELAEKQNEVDHDPQEKNSIQANDDKIAIEFNLDKLSSLVVDTSSILELKPLKHNPFADKIVDLFTLDEDGGLKFEDFLDMCSVFSPKAPLHLKLRVAFYIFDKDNDGRLDKEDIDYVISRMVDHHMVSDQDDPQSIQAARDRLFREADIDQSGYLSLKEFEKLSERIPDFESRFSFVVEL